MFAPQRPTLQVPESFTCACVTPPAHLLSPSEVQDVVAATLEHLRPRLAGARFIVSSSVAVGTTRQVFTVSALDTDEAFVVKVTDKGPLHHEPSPHEKAPSIFRSDWVKRHIALEEEVPFDGYRLVSVASRVTGETLLAHATQRGLSEREWNIAYTTIPTLMRAIWREVRSPYDQSLGLILDHHFDNILIGTKQPPFHDPSSLDAPRFVFVDGRNDGLHHTESALEEALEDFHIIFKRYAFVRSTWG